MTLQVIAPQPLGPNDSVAGHHADVVSRLADVAEHLKLLYNELNDCSASGFGLRRHSSVPQVELMAIIDQVRTAHDHLGALGDTILALRALGAAQPVSHMYIIRNDRVEAKQWFDDDAMAAAAPGDSVPNNPAALDERPTMAELTPASSGNHTRPIAVSAEERT